jgi:orotate phosphoribosyltransferase
MDSSSALREQLRQLLIREAILYSTPAQPITHRTGEISPWAFYSWNITLSEHGLRLAARQILDALQTFGSTQLASYGYTGLPLLAACVLESGGKYTGLSVRERRKAYLTNRRIDGKLDRGQPVVVIDDSLSAGTSLHKAITALEAEGLEVEGTVALVHFPFRGSKEWANVSGYRTVTLYDIWSDLGMAAQTYPPQEPYTGANRIRSQISTESLPEGLAPATLARHAAEFFLRTQRIPIWPQSLDASYDARGGTYVSFRRRDGDERIARDGFWHFDPADADPPRDVVLATIDTLQRGGAGITPESLNGIKIGVTFFGPLKEIAPAKLDFDKYGIVVRSKVWPNKLGGALPNTQVFTSEIEQYRHARKTNAQVADTEAHALYRHTITKFLEPGETWLPYGTEEDASTSWWREQKIGRVLTDRARQVIGGATKGEPLSNNLVATPVEAVAVTLYSNGLSGYGISYEADLDRALVAASENAWRDTRYAGKRQAKAEAITIAVSVLHNGEGLGNASRLMVERKVRKGLDAVTLSQNGKHYTLLPSALVYNAWSRKQFLDALASLAGGEQLVHSWRTHQVASWVSQPGSVLPSRCGFPVHGQPQFDQDRSAASIDLIGGYIHRAIGANGIPAYHLSAGDGDYVRSGTAARVLHGLYSLRIAGDIQGRADWKDAAARGVERCLGFVRHGTIDLPEHVGGALADVILLGAASACGLGRTRVCAEVAERVAGYIHGSGWIGEGVKRLDNPTDQEFLPGAAVWAMATYCKASGERLPESIRAARRFYGNRFREYPTWGCSWLAQGWGAVHDLTGDRDDASIAFSVADWVAERQLEKNGAFLEELSPDEPSFNTGFVAEGVAAAWRAALVQHDEARAGRYGECWRKACTFMRSLTLEQTDVFPFRRPELAIGGVRCTVSRGDIRIDQASHVLHALVEGYQNQLVHENRGVLIGAGGGD